MDQLVVVDESFSPYSVRDVLQEFMGLCLTIGQHNDTMDANQIQDKYTAWLRGFTQGKTVKVVGTNKA